MYSVGLTGGIGSGKSVVATEFERLGAALVDADQIAHAVTGPQGAAMEAIRRHFGDAMVDAHGALDRHAMRALAFAQPQAKAALEAIVHPLVRSQALAQAAAAQSKGLPYVVFAIPLLVEAGDWLQRLDRVLVIDCPEDEQLRRVQQRSGLPPAQIAAIIAQQAQRAQRLAVAHDVLVNAGPIDALPARVCRLHVAYLAAARKPAQQRAL